MIDAGERREDVAELLNADRKTPLPGTFQFKIKRTPAP
jgi:hypothetical protein